MNIKCVSYKGVYRNNVSSIKDYLVVNAIAMR